MWASSTDITTREKKLKHMYIKTTNTQNVFKANQLTVTATDNMYVPQLVKEYAEHMSGAALDIVSLQFRFSKQINHGRRWTVQDKFFVSSILHSSAQK